MKTIIIAIMLFLYLPSKGNSFKFYTGSVIEISNKSELNFKDNLNCDSLNIDIYDPFTQSWVNFTADSIINNKVIVDLTILNKSTYYRFKCNMFKDNIRYEILSEPFIRLEKNHFKLILNQIEEKVITLNELEAFPNPFNETFTLKSNNLKTIKIYNLNSQLIKEFKVNQSTIEINLNNFKSGFYMLIAETIDGKFLTKKIIKK